MMDAESEKRKVAVKPLAPRVGPARTLTSTRKRTMPDHPHLVAELRERFVVRRHAVVAVVPAEHEAEPAILFHDPMVASSVALFLETGELRSSLLP